MNFRNLHAWDVAPDEAVRIQLDLARKVRLEKLSASPRLIAGADISFELYSDLVHAAFVVLDLRTLKIVARSEAAVITRFPYIPGLLSFREIPPLLEAWRRLDVAPDVIMLDGQGIAHPRRLGIASHFGLFVNRPTVGCAKTLLCGEFSPPGERAGEHSPLLHRGEVIGAALRTKNAVQPVYISVGHRIDLPSAIRLTLRSCKGYRIPEPTRQAHLYANELRRNAATAA